MKEQKWFIFSSLSFVLVFGFVLFKEKTLLRHLEGEWEVKTYKEYIYDGSLQNFDLRSGSASFEKHEKEGASSAMRLELHATNMNDTMLIDWKGTYELKEGRKLILSDTTTHNMPLEVVRHTKNDLQLEGIFQPNRKSVIVFKKKK